MSSPALTQNPQRNLYDLFSTDSSAASEKKIAPSSVSDITTSSSILSEKTEVAPSQASEKTILSRPALGIWIDQAGNSFSLTRYKGRFLLVLVGYTSCPNLCPMITGQMKKLENILNQNQISSDKLQILFITVDKTDTVESLQGYATKHHLDPKRWTLAQASVTTKETFLEALSLNYDSTKSGDHMRHSFSLVLLNAQGQIKKTFPNILKLDPQHLSITDFQ